MSDDLAHQTRDYKKRSPREAAYHAIDGERDYQQSKYPGNKTLVSHTALLISYVSKVEDAAMNGHEPQKVTALMRKIAAIAVRAMEEHGAPVRT